MKKFFKEVGIEWKEGHCNIKISPLLFLNPKGE